MSATYEALNLAGLIHERLIKLAPVETLKLQKLMYYCNAWSLALREKPMFADEIQAWKHGPVVASLYQNHRGSVLIHDWPHGSGADVSKDDSDLAQQVIEIYGGRTGWALYELTHTESPWQDAWLESEQGRVRGFEISHGTMRDYYRSVLLQAQS